MNCAIDNMVEAPMTAGHRFSMSRRNAVELDDSFHLSVSCVPDHHRHYLSASSP
jgi:hypothetical protein